jgi:serine/threonine protein kinase
MRAATENMLASHASADRMSQQNEPEEEGTVIRPPTPASAGRPAATSAGHAGAPSDIAEDGLSLRIGAHVSEFEITRRIGEGGFSIVYLAMDHSLERIVALKEYMPSSLATRLGTTQVQPRAERYRDTFEAGLRSFVNEAKLLAQFDHPSLVKVYRFWEANGTAYMVMPFYQGVTVKDAVRAMPERPDEAWLLALLGPLTEALLVIHADRCFHRDIAPDNVILLASSSKPLLLDFGAARRVIGDMTQALTVILKSGYAPVEQYAEIPGMKQGPWTDVYALGAVVYWAITGKTPPASVGRMLSDSFIPLVECAAGRYSPGFLAAIDRALVVLPERRTQTIDAFRQDLGLAGNGSAAAPPTSWGDADATVIRPVGSNPGPASGAARGSQFVPAARTQTGTPQLAPLFPTQAPSVRFDRTLSETREPAPPQVRAAESFEAGADEASQARGGRSSIEARAAESSIGARAAEPSIEARAADRSVEARARDPSVAATVPASGARRTLLVASALGALALGAAAWWAVQRSGAEAPKPVSAPAGAIATEPVSRGAPAGVAPAAAVVPIEVPPPAPSSTPSSPVEVPPTVAEANRPIPAAPPPSADSNPAVPPVRAAKKATPPDPRVERNTDLAAQRADAARRERPATDSANQAECGRIFQRLSLGESSPELIERLKSLKCR